MTRCKRFKATLSLFMIILILTSNNIICYANDNYLDNGFWDTIKYSENIIVESHLGSNIKISYNCSATRNGVIGLYIDIADLPFLDSVNELSPKVSYYIHNNDDNISAILNYDSTIKSNNDEFIKEHGINYSRFNDSYRFLSYIKTNNFSKDTQLTTYITIDNCRYMLLNNVNIFDFLHEEQTEFSSDKQSSQSTTKNVKEPNNDKNTDKNNEPKTDNSKNNSSKDDTKKKYYNSSNNKYSNQSPNNDHNYDYDSSQQQENNSTHTNQSYYNGTNNTYKNNSDSSTTSKIAMISGSSMVVIGLVIATTSMIFYRNSKNNE